MISTIARKEFYQALLTVRFAVGLILCVVAVAAGTLAMIEDYESRRQAWLQQVRDYETEVLEREGPYARLVYDLKAFREPRQLGVFSIGSDRWQGNEVRVTHHEVPVYSRWLGLSNPLMALFRSVDVTLIVQIILGLLALLFAHDTVCGERERGTLRLMLANPVARDQVLLGKAAGPPGPARAAAGGHLRGGPALRAGLARGPPRGGARRVASVRPASTWRPCTRSVCCCRPGPGARPRPWSWPSSGGSWRWPSIPTWSASPSTAMPVRASRPTRPGTCGIN